MESDLEELHDSEQRWAAKHKRAIEQVLLRPLSCVKWSVFIGRYSIYFFFLMLDGAAADEADPGEGSE